MGNELFVTNSGDGTISRIDEMATVSTFLSGFSAPNGPFGISFDPTGTNLFFIDHQSGNVYRSDLNGNTQVVATVTSLGGTYTSIGFDDMVFVSDTNQANLYSLDSQNNFTVFASNFEGKSSPPAIGPNDSIFDGVNSLFVGDGNFIWKITRIPTTVTIDIKPSKKTVNKISFKKDKNLKVAILGDATFDALQVDPSTVKFGPSEASPARFNTKDYNRDGFVDLILTFKLNETGIACGDTEAILTGKTFPTPVTDIQGIDSFTTEDC